MQKLSQKIADLVSQHSSDGVALGQLLSMMDKQGTGFLWALLALPLLVPLPPGMGSPIAILLFVWSFQRLLGVHVPWCPEFLRSKRLSAQAIEKLMNRGIPVIQKIERHGSGNGSQMSETAVKAACLVVIIMSLLIILPTPFLNPFFAFIILLLGISMITANLRLYATGIIAGTVSTALLFSVMFAAISDGGNF
ncbi:MAG: exopolysaccharide biosynthesis protein [Dethiobacter sp.]|jgi:hypothetical protein|nr:MAG: exopolysaccharide biosynthesis protein [Dethiobacter sp.]